MSKPANAVGCLEFSELNRWRRTHPTALWRSDLPSRDMIGGYRCHRAFTLLELLLTLALTMALMVAVSSSLYGYYRWRDAGERQIEQGRTWLALTRAIEDDLLTVTRSKSMTANKNAFGKRIGSNLATTSEGNFSEEQIDERVLNFGYEFSLEPLLLYGDSSFMALGQIAPTTSQTPSPMNKRALTQTVVIWTSKSTESLRVPFKDQSDSVAFGSVSATNLPTLDLTPRSRLKNKSGLVSRVAVVLGQTLPITDRVAYPPQFQDIRFRYWDGERWVSRWNSLRQRRLPSAVEVRVQRSADSQVIQRIYHISSEPEMSQAMLRRGLLRSDVVSEDAS